MLEASFPPKQVLLKTTNFAADSQELRSPGEGGTLYHLQNKANN